MADETRSAEVQLTADVSGYQAGITQATAQTNAMIASVNKLSTSMEGITKRIGKKILWFTAGDVAAMTAMTVGAARYERQLSTLAAQAAVVNKTMDTYRNGITKLSKELPKSRGEIAQLVTQINQLGVTSQRETIKMARTFTNLSAATGDDLGALTQGMIELTRQMGNLAGGDAAISGFSDSLTTVSNSAGVAATSVLNFAQSISPFARAAGIGQAELIGISAAFTKAGADGYAAANTFNSIVADITRQIQNGSPEIAKYANVLGMTVEQFKELSMTERLASIFEVINRAGPDAVLILDRLGQDGIRAARSIQAVSNQAGGLRAAVAESVKAFGTGTTQVGADAAFDTLESKLTVLKNNMAVLGSAIGDAVLPPAKALLTVLNNMVTSASGLMEPIMKVGGAIAAVLAPVTGAVGAIMTMMGPLSTLMMAFMAMRFTPIASLLGGMKEGLAQMQGKGIKPGDVTPAGTNIGARIWRADNVPGAAPVPFYQRRMYELGQRMGESRVGVGMSRFAPPSFRALGTATADLTRSLVTGTRMWYQDAALRGDAMYDRRSIFRNLGPTMTSMGEGVSTRFNALTGAMSGDPRQWLTKYRENMEAATKATAAATTATIGQAAATNTSAAATGNATKGLLSSVSAYAKNAGTVEAFGIAMRRVTGQLLMLPLTAGRFGVRAGAQVVGGVAQGVNALFGGLGGMVGGGAGTGAILAAAIGMGYMAKQASDKNREFLVDNETLTNIGPVNVALGRSTETLSSFTTKVNDAKRELTSLGQASRLTKSEIVDAFTNDYADQRVAGLDSSGAAVSYMRSLGPLDPDQMLRVMQDITKKFGTLMAEEIRTSYMAATGNGQFPYGGNSAGVSTYMGGLLQSAANSTNNGWVGAFRNTPVFEIPFGMNVDDNTNQQVAAVWAAIEQNAVDVGKKYGESSGNLVKFLDAFDVLNQGFDAARGGDAGGNAVLQQSVGSFENMLGAELGLTKTGTGYRSGFGDNITSSEELVDWMWTAQEEGAQRFRDQMEQLGIRPNDFENNAIGLRRAVFDRSTGQLSDYESRLRRTELGTYARGSARIREVTEGDKIGDPLAIKTAVDDLVSSVMQNKDATGGVTTEFQRLKNAVVDVNDPLYQLAAAAMQAAQAQEQYRAQSGGWTKEFLTRWDQISEQLATPNLQEEEKSQLTSDRRALTTDLRDRFKSIVMSLREFGISQERARESFDRNMRRSIEDASQSWMSVATRAANQQAPTNSPWLLQYNAGEILDTVQGQLSSLRDLRRRGMSDKAINMMNLTDPSMGYQAQRLSDQASADEIKAFNRLAAQREKAVEALTKEFSKPFTRAEEDFKIATDQAVEDMIRMGDEATGTIKELAKEATALAEQMGVADMAGLAKALSVFGQLPKIDEENKVARDEDKAKWAWADRWKGLAQEEADRAPTWKDIVHPFGVNAPTAEVSTDVVNIVTSSLKYPGLPAPTKHEPTDTPGSILHPFGMDGESEKTSRTTTKATPVIAGGTTSSSTTYNSGTSVAVYNPTILAENPEIMAAKLKEIARRNAMKAGAATTP